MDEKLVRSAQHLRFPEAVAQLTEAGVVRYVVDLIRFERTLYGSDDETLQDEIALDPMLEVAPRFSEAGVKAALKAVQAGKIAYPEFLQQIMTAGVACYSVYINGRKVIYTGRDGGELIEPFPGGK
jgi:uncharacterized protein YbcV (DUF1398 family)